MENGEKPIGAAVAASWGAGLGLLALAISHTLADAYDGAKTAMQEIGKAWMPGAEGIGPYSGKETTALIVWFVSWGILHLLLRKRAMNLMVSGTIFLILIGLATTLLWPPVNHQVVNLLTGK